MDGLGILTTKLGEGFALMSAFAFALANISISQGAVRSKGDNGVLPSVIVTALVSGIVWLVLGTGGGADHGSAAIWVGIAWFTLSGLLTTVFGRIFLHRSIEHLGVTRASALKRLNPFFSVLFADAILAR